MEFSTSETAAISTKRSLRAADGFGLGGFRWNRWGLGGVTADAPHILVVDDDNRLRELLRKYLADSGFRVTTAMDAADARHQLKSLAFDLIVLDVMMPGESGFAFTESLRRASTVPILLLTAMGEPDDRITGLELGADDYLAKPFEPRELVLRIRTILRRARPAIAEEVRLGDCRFDTSSRILRRDGEPVHLTSAERDLLQVLAADLGVPLSREELIRRGRISGNARTVDVQVARLRRKIEPDPRLPRYIQTIRGEGYVLWPD